MEAGLRFTKLHLEKCLLDRYTFGFSHIEKTPKTKCVIQRADVNISMIIFCCYTADAESHFYSCRWFKLHSKAGRKEKERGGLQVTVQFTRNNMTASMFDLTIKDKPRSAFGKLKDRVTGRKRGDVESSSAIVPGRYAALSGSLGQPFGEEGGGAVESRDVEVTEEKRSKMKDFFKGKLRKGSDTRSCSSLASESSVSSMASDNLGPPPNLDLLSDPPSSPIYTSKVRGDTHYGETDLAKQGRSLF